MGVSIRQRRLHAARPTPDQVTQALQFYERLADGREQAAADVDRSAQGSGIQPRAAIVIAATDIDGRFWPRKAADFIVALDMREARAQALAEVPAAFRLMVRTLVERFFYNKSKSAALNAEDAEDAEEKRG